LIDSKERALPLVLAEIVLPLCMSHQKISPPELKSFETIFLAWLKKATYRPSLLISGDDDAALPLVLPSALTLTSELVCVCKSRTKMSLLLLVLLATKSRALLTKATKRPFPLMAGSPEKPFAVPVPLLFTLTSTFVPVCKSRTKMSWFPFPSFVTTLSARLVKATNRPSALRELTRTELKLLAVSDWPVGADLETRSVVSVVVSRTKTSKASLLSFTT